MSSFYHIKVGSLPGYEELIAEIYIDNRFVGLLSQEAGPQETLLEIDSDGIKVVCKFRLETFEKALAEAKQRLFQLKRQTS